MYRHERRCKGKLTGWPRIEKQKHELGDALCAGITSGTGKSGGRRGEHSVQGPEAEGMVVVTEEASIDPKASGTAAAQAKAATAVGRMPT